MHLIHLVIASECTNYVFDAEIVKSFFIRVKIDRFCYKGGQSEKNAFENIDSHGNPCIKNILINYL